MKKKRKSVIKSFKEIADEIIEQLVTHNIEAYIWHYANTGSIYIRFKDPKMCSIRIGDHDGREQYKYKYNLRSDITNSYYDKSDGHWRCYYSMNDQEKLIQDLISRRNKLQNEWANTTYDRSYAIPSFKRK